MSVFYTKLAVSSPKLLQVPLFRLGARFLQKFLLPREISSQNISLRLVCVELPKEEITVLATSLIDEQQYPSKLFKDLYHFKGWKVETYYDELKNKLNVELFSSYAENNIRQDFYCAIFVSNIQSFIVKELQQDLMPINLKM